MEVVDLLQARYDSCTTDQERANPQKGEWIYKRDAPMRRHFKRSYPEYFALADDESAARKRREWAGKAERVKGERFRRGNTAARIPAIKISKESK